VSEVYRGRKECGRKKRSGKKESAREGNTKSVPVGRTGARTRKGGLQTLRHRNKLEDKRGKLYGAVWFFKGCMNYLGRSIPCEGLESARDWLYPTGGKCLGGRVMLVQRGIGGAVRGSIEKRQEGLVRHWEWVL